MATSDGLYRGKIHILSVRGIDPSSFILLQQLIIIDQTGGAYIGGEWGGGGGVMQTA